MAYSQRERYLKKYVPLHIAALKGDWKAAKGIIEQNPELINAHITEGQDTALHVAAAVGHVHFLKKLVDQMDEHHLETQNNMRNTALSFAAATGNVRIAKYMVTKNPRLPSIRGPQAKSPLYYAALLGRRDMVEYLRGLPPFWTPQEDQIELLNTCIISDLYDAALSIVKEQPQLALARDHLNKETPLDVLARKPSAFASGNQRGLWETIIDASSFWEGARNQKLMQTKSLELLQCLWDHVIPQEGTGSIVPLLFVAAERGNDIFLVQLLRFYPDFILKINNKKQSIFHIAVLNRHEHIFNLIYEIGSLKELIATYRDPEDDNNMLHLAAKLAPPNQINVVSGAALQMQRQLAWYKAVEKIVQPSYRDMKNRNGQAPHDLFMAEHKELMKEGEKWMKDTANSCMLVAALIATLVFTTSFTVPGGNDNTTGAPILLNESFFTVFSVSEQIAMLSSSTSILMFLSILTSCYAENDFLQSLPIRLMIGVTTLFISIAAMMIAFCATFILSYHHGLAHVLVLFSLFAFVPIVFILLNYFLLVDIIRSTFGSRFLFHSRKRLFPKTSTNPLKSSSSTYNQN
ncbi:hypothetical protein F0562_025232 [Nyssa sinensis]|uniref:PGG domain-containing protein n=1 Tax=Nyssa sinensis TaxID=561372 RepID=A0A5J5BEZ7_9ASTE|nr:hypothetical protein F0562_025232 [Nyssa sinensis]